MSPDDPRHGTYAGASQHWKDGEQPCAPCRQVSTSRRKRNRYLDHTGRPQTVPKLGTVRRIRALQALGWTLQQIADTANLDIKTVKNPLYRGATCYRATSDAIEHAYDTLSMRFPPEGTTQQKRDASYARNAAKRRGWMPPLWWDDIDTDTEPGERVNLRAGRPNDDIDPVVVDQLLDGRRVPSTPAEKREAMRRWLDAGRSEKSLCELMGWKDGRYKPRKDDAA